MLRVFNNTRCVDQEEVKEMDLLQFNGHGMQIRRFSLLKKNHGNEEEDTVILCIGY